jgi:glutathione S-transferase
MYKLFIANKKYSSWSLRPWVLMKTLGLAFEEVLLPFQAAQTPQFGAVSPTGRVPCLQDGQRLVWDSLAMTEYLAERHAGVWPQDEDARAFARCAAAEMHSGFAALRSHCGMNCAVRVTLREVPTSVQADLARIDALWTEGLKRFGGPFLAGKRFSAADAFFAPVAFRIQTFELQLSETSQRYAQNLITQPAMMDWYQQALAETWRDEPHEAHAKSVAAVFHDLRVA